MTNAIFIHHSVGRHLIAAGRLRMRLRARPDTSGIALWDIDYRKLGTHGPDGEPTDIGISIPDDNTGPDGLLRLLTAPEHAELRDRCSAFDLLIHKSCYPASHLSDERALRERIDLYEAVLNSCTKLPVSFLLLTPPPLTPLRTNRAAARNAVEFTVWLNEIERPANVDVFDLHRVLRTNLGPHLGSLAPEYRPLAPWDSHPNLQGCNAAAAALAAALGRSAPRSGEIRKESPA